MAINKLTNPAVSASGEVDSLLIEKFTGRVKEAYVREENLLRFFDVQTVTGTNVVSEKFMGDTEIQILAAGQSPDATTTQYDKNALVVDTTVIARNAEAMFHNIQSDLEGNHSKLSKNQASQLARLEDEMVIQQLIYGAQENTKAKRTNARVSGHGFSQQVSITDAQVQDPEALIAAVELVIENLLTGIDGGDGVDVTDLYSMMPWPIFNIMRDAERIVNGDYSTFEGSTVSGFTLKSYNLPVIPSNRFPRLVGGNVISRTSKLSNPNNGFRYTATEEHAKTVAVLFSSNALLAGKTIDMTGDIFFDKLSKSYIIDTFQSEGAIPSSWEAVGVVDTNTLVENAAVKARAARKVKKVKSV